MNDIGEKLASILFEPVVFAEEMAAIDAHTINHIGVPGAVLMEQAGRAVAEQCLVYMRNRSNPKVLVVCGPGNNGGDGFVVARLLAKFIDDITVVFLGKAEKLTGDAKQNADIWRNLKGKTIQFDAMDEAEFYAADLIVDAMLGTGAKGELRPPFARAASLINQSAAHVVAVDLPTGIDANTAEVFENAVRADATVTFGAAKPGHLFSPARECIGQLSVADIGFPRQAFRKINSKKFNIIGAEVMPLLPVRSKSTFKNRCGQILILAGSESMPGAAALTSEAALRAGAGLIVLSTDKKAAHQFANLPIEIMRSWLTFEHAHLAAASKQLLETHLAWANVVAIGPGLGTSDAVKNMVKHVISSFKGALILDADGLNCIAGDTAILKKRPGPTVITPHPGEFCRLASIAKEALPPAPIAAACEFAEKHNVITLLKGAPSLIAFPGGEVYLNSAGNPGMATGGMGDVLTGVITGLAGQIPVSEAAVLGMYLHSHAADLAIEQIEPISLIATDVIDTLPDAIQSLRRMHAEKFLG